MVPMQYHGNLFEIYTLKEGIFRVRMARGEEFRESLMSKYHILKEPTEIDAVTEGNRVRAGRYWAEMDEAAEEIRFGGGTKELHIRLRQKKEGFRYEIPVEKNERLYGLGDESRDSIMKRGRIAYMWQANVTSYGPIPYLMSSCNWSMLNNCTYDHTYDLAKSDPDTIRIEGNKGEVDFYIFLGDSMVQLLERYTDISGKPVMLPNFAYGFTFVANEEEGAREVLDDCLRFRREDIPCDIIGLEPAGWMETHYDYTTEKKWSDERFYIPYWQPKNQTGTWTFFYNFRKMGFKLSLWLCCDYDLLWEEEHRHFNDQEVSFDGAEIMDTHFGAQIRLDKLTKDGEPWFEHLKKFVDNGASAFKLDGANQVMEHPDRLWAGKYLDDEVHNIYPVIYAKQMKEGFENYTGRRAMIYTPAMYAGTQQYAATWAGDTGGGEKTLVSILNLGMCGLANASCDLDPSRPETIHYGFLMPWSQLLGWRNWHQPWYLGDEIEAQMQDYSKLRSTLFPYIYSMAHKSAETGLPLARPLALMYQEREEYDNVTNMYLLGDSLLVGAFCMDLTMPEGKWYDFWTEEVIEGDRRFHYVPPKGKGGALFVKAGSVLVRQKAVPHVDKPHDGAYDLHVYAGGSGKFCFVEDDGVTYDYQQGGMLRTEMIYREEETTGTLIIGERTGYFAGNPCDYEYDVNTMSINDRSNVPSMPGLSDFEVKVHSGTAPKKVWVNGEPAEGTWADGILCVSVPKELPRPCEVKIEYV